MEPTKLTRTTAKQDKVVESLRRDIVQGRITPGRQFPSQPQLAKRFQVSLATIGLAVNRLAREGHVQTRHRRGTFVSDKPPHLNNYALVFWNDPSSRFAPTQWSRYYTALTNEAIALQQREGRRILIFHGIDQHADSEDRQRLLSYIESHRLAGIIFANSPDDLEDTSILQQPGIPRVALMSSPCYPGVPAVAYSDHWMERAFDYLLEQGRQRIAILMHGTDSSTDSVVDRVTAARGMTIPPHWRQIMPVVFSLATRNCVRLLMYSTGLQRPDGLVIADDNFVEDAQAALVAAGVRVPDDVAVVAHCNFPWPPANVLPVKRLGYDIRETLRTCIHLIDRQRRGEEVPQLNQIPALFEEELGAAAKTSAFEEGEMLTEQRR